MEAMRLLPAGIGVLSTQRVEETLTTRLVGMASWCQPGARTGCLVSLGNTHQAYKHPWHFASLLRMVDSDLVRGTTQQAVEKEADGRSSESSKTLYVSS